MKHALAIGLVLLSSQAFAQTTLRVFVGGQQRPDVMKKIFAEYEKNNPGVKVELEVGGATSEAQQQYLSTVLNSGDKSIDIFLLDIVRVAQYAQSGWAEPLDAYIPNKNSLLKQYLPAYAAANTYNGRLYALPAFADAMFLYYRKDLLAKHRLLPPKTWEDMIRISKTIVEKEKNPNLRGFSYQAAPIEGTVCSFLVPFWGQGGNLSSTGQVNIDSPQGQKAMQFLVDLSKKENVAPNNSAEIKTDDTRRLFQSGNYVFAQLWAYGWNRFQEDADSAVKDKVGVVKLPAFAGSQSYSCLGGWEWAVSAFSANKKAAASLVQYLGGKEVSKTLAIEASNLPVFPALYRDADVLKVNPWFKDALPTVQAARQRPVSPRYPQISAAINTNVNAVIAGVRSVDQALKDMQDKLSSLLK
ncbi:ABC transporter substrate-binding protein [Deinococcus peraridilitoris]|uniref:ABC-type sugar transport system, periplasmic component n=1 Tax=Deinococcus peraridilitoris (strain DSM 19664 / LMG 22246 / CIP 109416 / KR-200) TaxID=937777 RepID=L0A660_DEIPD|nr:ABC transporter substrate-binding protein [Deinococcus peraridilitoris]AFZ69336.1 ABC-type sugar transport system, periplasmic component [Deinococcus peraridilitoris DSM 19664]